MEEDLETFLLEAPCIKSGKLSYLDLSSHPLSGVHLNLIEPQPALRSLGLSFIPDLALSDITNFLLKKAPNVEVVTLISTSPQLAPTAPTRQNALAVRSQLIQNLCPPPFSQYSCSTNQQAATRLRVIELEARVLSALGGGADSWKVIRSKGARGWYVDTASGWTAEGDGPSLFRRSLSSTHPLRKGLESLSESGGNISTAIGWHARKVEVLRGDGLLGREDGLYGAMSFSFGS
jgi:hypothetical protein